MGGRARGKCGAGAPGGCKGGGRDLGDDFGGFGLERATRQEDAEPCACVRVRNVSESSHCEHAAAAHANRCSITTLTQRHRALSRGQHGMGALRDALAPCSLVKQPGDGKSVYY